jgi:hypothetical protein
MLVQLSSTSYNLSNLCGIATGTAGKKSHIDAPNRSKKKRKKRKEEEHIIATSDRRLISICSIIVKIAASCCKKC